MLVEEYAMRMNTVFKMTVGCIFAFLVLAISSGNYSVVQVNAQNTITITEAQISNIPEIHECQMLHPSWNASADDKAFQKFEQKDCWKQLERDPITGETLSTSNSTN